MAVHAVQIPCLPSCLLGGLWSQQLVPSGCLCVGVADSSHLILSSALGVGPEGPQGPKGHLFLGLFLTRSLCRCQPGHLAHAWQSK